MLCFIKQWPLSVLMFICTACVSPSAPISATSGLSKPSMLMLSAAGNGRVRLDWNPVSGADGQYVFVRESSSTASPEPVAKLAADVSHYEFSGLEAGQTYVFGVQAFRGSQSSETAWSRSWTVSPNPDSAVELQLTDIAATSASALFSYSVTVREGTLAESGVRVSTNGDPLHSGVFFRNPRGVSREGSVRVSSVSLEYATTCQARAYARIGTRYYYSDARSFTLGEAPAPIVLDWSPVTVSGLPAGISVYKTTSQLNGRNFNAWYAAADCTGDVEFRVLNPSSTATIESQAEAAGDCYVLVNGGIFGTKHIGVIIADGVRQAWRAEVDGSYWGEDGKLYNITRAGFGVDAAGHPDACWVSAPTAAELYYYDRPMPSVMGEGSLPPASSTWPGAALSRNPKHFISTGPMVLYQGKYPVDLTPTGTTFAVVDSGGKPTGETKPVYATNYEVWKSDIFPGPTDNQPHRTAVGYTEEGRIILFICDGRSTASRGADLLELGRIMKGLGCVSAVNFDGGGSTGMWVCGQHLNATASNSRKVMSTIGFFRKK